MCQNRVRSGFPRRVLWRSLFLRVRMGSTEPPVAVAAGGVSRDATTCCLPTCPASPSHRHPALPISSPLEAGGSISVHITLTPNYLNTIEVSLLWHFYNSPCCADHSRPYTSIVVWFNAPLVRGSALASSHACLAVERDPPNAEHTLGAGQRVLEAAAPQGQLPIPLGTRSSALTGSTLSGRP